jgi:hypothetical protein
MQQLGTKVYLHSRRQVQKHVWDRVPLRVQTQVRIQVLEQAYEQVQWQIWEILNEAIGG